MRRVGRPSSIIVSKQHQQQQGRHNQRQQQKVEQNIKIMKVRLVIAFQEYFVFLVCMYQVFVISSFTV